MRIPAAFREEHELNVRSRYWSKGAIRGSRVYRAGGACRCGAKFGLWAEPKRSNMDRADVIAAHREHVEAAYATMVAGEESEGGPG